MMLKKQTVWLLTMVALVVVLSVYYLVGGNEVNNVANPDQNNDSEQTDGNNNGGVNEVTDEVFEAIRLQMQDERSRRVEELQNIMVDSSLSAEEKSAAKDEMDRIHEIADQERFLETLIKSTLNYEDALVRSNGKEVSITVKGGEATKASANEIVKLVKREVGTSFVQVSFQTKAESDDEESTK